MLWQSGAFRENQDVNDRVMDSMDLEREKGITILAKNTAVRYNGVKLNIIDTPGHADFGGEVERGLTMVDGVLLLVDASEGPLPQTRFVLRKALESNLPVILVINKVDRPDARISEVVDEVYELFIDLGASEKQIEFPVVYTNARAGCASLTTTDQGTTLQPLMDMLLDTIPAPEYDEGKPLQAHVTNLDASPTSAGSRSAASATARSRRAARSPGAAPTARSATFRVAELYITEALDRVDAAEAGPGEIIAVAGMPDVTIGETLADLEDPQPLPVITVDEPSISVTIGINLSPLAGQGRHKLTARQIQDRLTAETIGNVSIRVLADRAPGHLGGPGPRRAAARDPRRDHAPRGLRAHRRQAAGRHPRDRRQAPRAGRAHDDRRARGVRRRDHADARPAQGPHGADDQPRHRLGPDGLPRAGPRADRLPHRVPHRHARHRPAAPRVRGLGAVGGRHAPAPDRLARRRPHGQDRELRALQPAGARDDVRRARRGRLRGHDRGRERAPGGPRRQRRQGEAPDQRALLDFGRAGAAGARAQALARPGAGVRARGRMRRSDARIRSGCARSSSRAWTASAKLAASEREFDAYTRAALAPMPTGPPKFEDLLEAAPDAMVGTDAAGVAVFANARAKALLGRDPVGEPLGELPAGAGRHALARWATTSWSSCATPTRARCAPCSTTRRRRSSSRTPTGATCWSTARSSDCTAGPPSSCSGRLDREVLPPEIAERMRVDDLRVMSEREPIELQEEVTPRRADAHVPVGQVPADRRADGELYGVGGVATDITHHIRLEARLREAQRLEAVGQLAGGVAHDFNNLLAVIANYAAFVRKELPDDSRAAGDVDQIITASRRASELTRRLLLFSRRQSGTPEVLSLRRVIECARAAAAAHARRRDRPQGRLRRAPVGRRGRPQPARAGADEPGHELARGDARRRRAADRGRRTRSCAIRTARPRAPCALTVTDTGRGMAARGRRARLRAVLHHQGGLRPRRRARPGDGLRDRHQGARAGSSSSPSPARARRSR